MRWEEKLYFNAFSFLLRETLRLLKTFVRWEEKLYFNLLQIHANVLRANAESHGEAIFLMSEYNSIKIYFKICIIKSILHLHANFFVKEIMIWKEKLRCFVCKCKVSQRKQHF